MLRLLLFFLLHEEVSTETTALQCRTMFSRWSEVGFTWDLTVCIKVFLLFRQHMWSFKGTSISPSLLPSHQQVDRVRTVLNLCTAPACKGLLHVWPCGPSSSQMADHLVSPWLPGHSIYSLVSPAQCSLVAHADTGTFTCANGGPGLWVPLQLLPPRHPPMHTGKWSEIEFNEKTRTDWPD